MDHSRREFFKAIVPKTAQIKSGCGGSSIVTLGHLAIFPVHSSTKIRLFDDEFVVESLPEGIRLQNILTNQNLKLSLNNHGLIQAHLNELWPATAVLSIFTGEIYNI
jgi:hypothetical protein